MEEVGGTDGSGVSVASSGSGVSGVSSSGEGGGVALDTSVNMVLGVSDHGGGHGLLDDGLSLNGHGVGHVVGGIHVHGGGHRDDVLLVHGHVVGHVNTTLHQDRTLHVVHLDLLLDDGGVVGDGSLEDGGHADGKMGGGGLDDPGVVAGDKAGLSQVDLLGDDGGWLVHGGHAGGLAVGGEGGGGRGGHVVDWVGHHGAGLERVGGQGRGSGGLGVRHRVSGVATDSQVVGSKSQVLGSRHGTGQDKGKCDLQQKS